MPEPPANPGRRPDADEEHGIDLEHGMLVTRGRPERLHTLLREFVAESARDIAQIRQRCTAQDAPGARQAAHALRGAAALVGAHRLHARTQSLESLLAEPVDFAAALATAAQMETDRQAIARHLGAWPAATPEPSDRR